MINKVPSLELMSAVDLLEGLIYSTGKEFKLSRELRELFVCMVLYFAALRARQLLRCVVFDHFIVWFLFVNHTKSISCCV